VRWHCLHQQQLHVAGLQVVACAAAAACAQRHEHLSTYVCTKLCIIHSHSDLGMQMPQMHSLLLLLAQHTPTRHQCFAALRSALQGRRMPSLPKITLLIRAHTSHIANVHLQESRQ